MSSKHILCFHILNDRSGSPRVLKMSLESLLHKGFQVDLFTSDGGVLDELEGIKGFIKHSRPYSFGKGKILTLFNFLFVQIWDFFTVLCHVFDKDTILYVNTLLPVAPALAGRLVGKKVIYHYHEYAPAKGRTYSALSWMMQKLASKIVCVSEWQRNSLRRIKGINVVPNAVSDSFVENVQALSTPKDRAHILMLCSLKGYKGIAEFVHLANLRPDKAFELVINASQTSITTFFAESFLNIPNNLKVLSSQNDVAPFYAHTSLLLNLSDRRKFQETFGLTVIEAMAAGVPAIVPEVGGISELVIDGVNGYHVDACDLDKLSHAIDSILSDENTYAKMSENATKMLSGYRQDALTSNLMKVFEDI